MFFVYLMASKRQGTLYLGVTNNLGRRAFEHREKIIPGFSARYDVDRLVWYESYERIDEAIVREKALKTWRRAWKIALIEAMNPQWDDLYPTLNQRRPSCAASHPRHSGAREARTRNPWKCPEMEEPGRCGSRGFRVCGAALRAAPRPE